MQNQNSFDAGQEQYESRSIYQQPMINANGIPLVNYYAQNQKQIETAGKTEDSQLGHSTEGALLRKTAFQRLEEEKGIFIKQKLDLFEVLTLCQTQNIYLVYPLEKDAIKKEHILFKCQEKSTWCARNCLPGRDRPFQMTISTLRRGVGEDQKDTYEPFLFLDRPCKCTCFCRNRPEISVTLVEDGKNEYLGKLVDPFSCCSLEAAVYDKDNILSYIVEGACCQLGVVCPMPCKPCQRVDFDVKTTSGEVVSAVQKVTAGCLKAAVSNVDNFVVNFPNGVTVTQKALLMCAVLLLDYSNFEKKPGNNAN